MSTISLNKQPVLADIGNTSAITPEATLQDTVEEHVNPNEPIPIAVNQGTVDIPKIEEHSTSLPFNYQHSKLSLNTALTATFNEILKGCQTFKSKLNSFYVLEEKKDMEEAQDVFTQYLARLESSEIKPSVGIVNNNELTTEEGIQQLLVAQEEIGNRVSQVDGNEEIPAVDQNPTVEPVIIDENFEIIKGRHNSRLENLKLAREAIFRAKETAIITEKEINKQKVNEFGPLYLSTGLPQLHQELQQNNEEILQEMGLFKLVTQKTFETKKDQQDAKQNPIYKTVKKTNNGKGDRWIHDKDPLKNIEKGKVLETETLIKIDENAHCLENNCIASDPHRVHKFNKDDQDKVIIQRMNNRVNFLKNPRFDLPSLVRPVFIDGKKKIQGSDIITKKPEHTSIQAIPAVVCFTDYVPKKTYHQHLILKNRTSNSTRFRITDAISGRQPSPFFTFKKIHSPFQEDSTVAPGISCEYVVSFTPDSFANFYHEFLVTSESGDSFFIPIKAERAGPKLTLPQTLVCGPCRIGKPLITMFDFKNEGDCGKFYILESQDKRFKAKEIIEKSIQAVDEDDLDESKQTLNEIKEIELDIIDDELFKVFKSFDESEIPQSTTKIGEFEIYPSYFELESGDTKQLFVKYTPPPLTSNNDEGKNRLDVEQITFICDNCKLYDYTIQGISNHPDITINDIFLDSEELKTSFNSAFDNTVYFGTQTPNNTTSGYIVLKNNTSLKIQYRWQLFINPTEKLHDDHSEYQESRAMINHKSCYNILPAEGIIKPNSEIKFSIEFTPTSTISFDEMAEFVLVPVDQDLSIPTDDENFPPSFDIKNSEKDEEIMTRIRCLGEGIIPNVEIYPPIINVPLTLYLKEYKTQIRLTNFNASPKLCVWRLQSSEFEVSASISLEKDNSALSDTFEIPPKSSIRLDLVIHGKFPGKVDNNIIFEIDNNPEYVFYVKIIADVVLKPGNIEFGIGHLDFGAVALGDCKSLQVPLSNKSDASVSWEIIGFRLKEHLNEGIGNESEKYVLAKENENKEVTITKALIQEDSTFLTCEPSSGILEPGENLDLLVTYIPLWYQNFKGILECKMKSLPDPSRQFSACAIQVSGFALTPDVDFTLVEPLGNIIECYMGTTRTIQIMLVNKTALPTKFKWNEPEIIKETDIDSATPRVTILDNDREGVIDGYQKKIFSLEFFCLNIGTCPLLRLSLHVEGMTRNNGENIIDFAIFSKGLCLDLAITDPKCNETQSFNGLETKSNLTSNVINIQGIIVDKSKLFESSRYIITLRNHSTIGSPFNMKLLNYPASCQEEFDAELLQRRPEQENEENQEEAPGVSDETFNPPDFSPLEQIGFVSVEGKKYISKISRFRDIIKKTQRFLADERGAAFVLKPSKGVVGPNDQVQIELICYNDLIGTFEDTIHIQVDKWMTINIPIHYTVSGRPITFYGAQINGKEPGNIEWLQLGPSIIGDPVEIARGSSNNHAALNCHKTFLIENQCHRDVVIDWKIYTNKRTKKDGIPEGPIKNISYDDVKRIMANNDADKIMENNATETNNAITALNYPFVVFAGTTLLPPFKRVNVKIGFQSPVVGVYDGIIASEVGYVCDGVVKYTKEMMKSKHSTTKDEEEHEIELKDSHVLFYTYGKSCRPKISMENSRGSSDEKALQICLRPEKEDATQKSCTVVLTNLAETAQILTFDAKPRNLFNVEIIREDVTENSRSRLKNGKKIHELLFNVKKKEKIQIAISLKKNSPISTQQMENGEMMEIGALKVGFSNATATETSIFISNA